MRQGLPILPDGFRYIEHDDARKDLKSFVDAMDRFSLEDYYQWSKEDGTLVVIREVEGKVAAVVLVTVHEKHLMIEMLARNKLHPYRGSAGDLIYLVEKILALHFRKQEVRLEAMQDVVPYYSGRGYKAFGKRYNDDDWGKLFPMRKRLGSS